MREDGLILWDDWNNTELFVRVTDGANLQTFSHLNIEVPPEESDDISTSENENSAAGGSGGVSTLLALIVALAIVILTIFTVMLAIRLRAQVDTDDETEETPEEPTDSESTVITTTVQPETLHVPDYNHLVGGGVYDQSTGHVAYIDLEGRWWWQQEDGSFFYDPTFNANDATRDDLP